MFDLTAVRTSIHTNKRASLFRLGSRVTRLCMDYVALLKEEHLITRHFSLRDKGKSQLYYTTRSVSSSQLSTAYPNYEIYSKTSVPNLMSSTS